MFALNNIQLIGHLTEDPKIRQLPNGTSVLDITLKTKEKIKKSDGSEIVISGYHSITFWRRAAEVVADYCRAGTQLFVMGHIKTDSWEDDKGTRKYKTKVIADDYLLLDSRRELPALAETSPVAGGLNQVGIIGNMTKDIEIRQTTSGQSVANFSLATNRRWQNKETGENQEETEFHNMVVWGVLAETAANTIKKGQRVYAQGRLQTRSWETPDGEKRYTTEIVADKVMLLGAKDAELAAGAGSAPANTAAPAAAPAAAPKKEAEGKEPEIPTIQYESDIKPEDLPF